MGTVDLLRFDSAAGKKERWTADCIGEQRRTTGKVQWTGDWDPRESKTQMNQVVAVAAVADVAAAVAVEAVAAAVLDSLHDWPS